MSMTHAAPVLNPGLLKLVLGLQVAIDEAAESGTAVHQVELLIWEELLELGHTLLQRFFDRQGDGDQGERVTLPDGRVVERLPEVHQRGYRSVFGKFELPRWVYGSREGQKIEYVPLDQRLQLPAGEYSYLLQDWAQGLCVEEAFGQARSVLARMLKQKVPVDSLERMNQEMAEAATPYRLNRPLPPAEEEGALFVVSADGKGVVMRRAVDEPAAAAHRTKGDKASRKQMATVGAIYSVDRFVRTPEEVVAALFHDPRDPELPRLQRPTPCHKEVWASLAQEPSPELVGPSPPSGQDAVFLWLRWELTRRNPNQAKETVYLHDGQEALWLASQRDLPQTNCVEILDLLHATPRLWEAAHVFHKEKSPEAEEFVRQRVLRVLRGEVAGVVQGLRKMATQHGLTGAKKRRLTVACNYLAKNRERMHYDEYLAKGYPIASGVIEGACRHLVKDRMERAGMHWTARGAEAMLEVRSLAVSSHWEEFQEDRIARATQRLYPHSKLTKDWKLKLPA